MTATQIHSTVRLDKKGRKEKKRKKMKIKFLRSSVSLLLAAAMLFGLLPAFVTEAQAVNTPVIDGVYEIVPVSNTNYAWDVKGYGSGTAADQLARVCLNPRNSSDAGQKWVIQRAVVKGELKDYYVLRNLENTRYLNLDGDTGTVLHFWNSYADLDSNKFYIDANGDGSYSIRSAADGASGTRYAQIGTIGANEAVTVDAATNSNKEKFYLQPVGFSYDDFSDGGTFTITNKLYSSYYCEIEESSTTAGGKFWIGDVTLSDVENGIKTITDNMRFIFEPTVDGHYTIRAAHSNLLLSSAGGNVTQQGTTVSNEEKWNVIPSFSEAQDSEGSFQGFYFVSVSDGRYMFLDDGATYYFYMKDTQWIDRQRFTLTKTDSGTAKGTRFNGETDVISSTFDLSNTMKLPIEIYDYKADGLLFEFAESTKSPDQTITITTTTEPSEPTDPTDPVETWIKLGTMTVGGTIGDANGAVKTGTGAVPTANAEGYDDTYYYTTVICNSEGIVTSVQAPYTMKSGEAPVGGFWVTAYDGYSNEAYKFCYNVKVGDKINKTGDNDGATITLLRSTTTSTTTTWTEFTTMTVGGDMDNLTQTASVFIGDGDSPIVSNWYTVVVCNSEGIVITVLAATSATETRQETAPTGGFWVIAHENHSAGAKKFCNNVKVGDKITCDSYAEGSTITHLQGTTTSSGSSGGTSDTSTTTNVTVHMGNNKGFGLLRASGGGSSANSNYYYSATGGAYSADAPLVLNQIGQTYSSASTAADDGAFSTIAAVSASTGDYSATIGNAIGYMLYNKITAGVATVGLLESTLGEDGNPVYKQETVTYVAQLLYTVLPIPEYTDSAKTVKNYNFAAGEPRAVYGNIDLPQALRNVLVPSGSQSDRSNYSLGTYNETAEKGSLLRGDWASAKANIITCFDAAYYLLNSIFDTKGYHVDETDFNYDVAPYDTLELTKVTTKSGKEGYIFDAGFSTSAVPSLSVSAVEYDLTNKTIRNTSAAGKTMYYHNTSKDYTTFYPFLPITTQNDRDGMTNSANFDDDGVSGEDSQYENRDYNYVLKSAGHFIYDADKELFFDFEGDDDVYLFINGQLVLDIGGAHGITKVSMELNDYVNAAYESIANGTATDRDRALALEDGKSYAFNFFYMERHGYGANMRILTNFDVSAYGAETEKHAYQRGELQSGSTVDTGSLVGYGFSIQNTSDEELMCFEFEDADLGVCIDYKNGLTRLPSANGKIVNADGEALQESDLRISILDENGIAIPVPPDLQNASLKSILGANGIHLESGQTIMIQGIYLKDISERMVANCFENRVATVCSLVNDARTKINGSASIKLYAASEPAYYQWSTYGLNISFAEFLNDVKLASDDLNNPLYGKAEGLTTDNLNSLTVCTAGGTPISSSAVSVDSTNKTLKIHYKTAGAFTAFIKITYNTSEQLVVPVQTYVLDICDRAVILDYGLKADVSTSGLDESAFAVPGRETTYRLEGHQLTGTPTFNNTVDKNCINSFTAAEKGSETKGSFGTFSVSDSGSLIYTPEKFMEGLENFYTAVRVTDGSEANAKAIGNIDIHSEVEMWFKTSIIPASVVYYEDDFPAIHYRRNGETVQVKDENGSTITVDAITTDGTGSTDLSQSVDNSEQYGHDATYESGGVAKSGNSAHIIEIVDKSVVADFTFRGTGFELIGRTNATDDTILIVEVSSIEKDEAGNNKYTIVRRIPVILEYDNNADGEDDTNDEGIYQVPVVRISGLEPDEYYVEIKGVPGLNGARTCFYLDGLRIYRPVAELNDENGNALEDLYLPNEKNATLEELRSMIVSNRAGVATVDTTGITIGTGTSTFTENRNSALYPYGESPTTFVGNTVGSVYDYLTAGPNNEVYLNGISLRQGIVLYFTLNEGVSLSDAELQIGLHKLDAKAINGGFEQDTDGALYQSGYENSTYKWLPVNTNISSATEQYYRIDLSACKYDEAKGRYELILYADQGMVSLTNVKYSGITIAATDGTPCTFGYNSLGTLVRLDESGESSGGEESKTWVAVENAAAYPDFASVSEQMASRNMMLTKQDPETVITPGAPEKPDAPTEATDPSEAPEPSEATETTGPSETVEPTEPSVPDEPSASERPTESTEPSKPTEPTEPIDVPAFTDVKDTWYADTVNALAAKGVIKGYEDGTFRGDNSLTRAEFVTLIVRAFGFTAAKDYQSPFTDVDGWAKEYIDAAASCGIVNGIAGTIFAPDDPITREQMMTILYRVQCCCELTLPALEEVPALKDLDEVSAWAQPAVQALISTGLIRGDDNNALLPQNKTTRAEAATVLFRLLEAAEKQEETKRE